MNPSIMLTSMSTYMMFIALGTLTIDWKYIFAACLPVLGLSFVAIREPQHLQHFSAIVKDTARVRDSVGKPIGYVVGKWYIGFIDQAETKGWVVCRSHDVKSFTQQPELKVPITALRTPLNPFSLMERCGTYQHFYYTSRKFPNKLTDPNPKQDEILDTITDHFASNTTTVAYIHGKAGVGKTMIGPLLASKLNGILCTSFNPSDPSDQLSRLYFESEVSKRTPLILVLDEVDTLLKKVHVGFENDRYPISVHNKSTWNQFLDSIDNGLYPHIILLLISNMDPADIDALDPSFIREGRVNFRFHLK